MPKIKVEFSKEKLSKISLAWIGETPIKISCENCGKKILFGQFRVLPRPPFSIIKIAHRVYYFCSEKCELHFWLTEKGKEISTFVLKKELDKENYRKNLYDMYVKKEMSMEEIAKLTGLDKSRIQEALRKYKIPIKKRNYPHISNEELEKMYLYWGMSISKIAIKLGVGVSVIERLMKKYKIPERDISLIRSEAIKKAKRGIYATKDELEELHFKKNMSYRDIAKHFDVSITTIGRWFKNFDIKPRKDLKKIKIRKRFGYEIFKEKSKKN